ncbi:hypothetical protein JH06_2267 [Blastocystis sp. subtype 4]|uniref:hypothetical protein n=1 Tax=Blastocystis sp. subtype 4 TaxID=944170 RepID=UPI000711E265|nr:hypothetical protein JH06_2267 [Blastocystis sp. subtype 4]KNB43821.1 hypothetical protein JH06_2267 [Blastocystis sp. subtype 4]|eukprot:XP_014527264.1 hypothetical protein JH06_2267 [Blastocystis sp. subtype 4]
MEIEEVSMDVAMTVDEACNQWKLSPILRQNLQNEGIQEFFEIQTRAIPQILDCDKCGIARDVTICAPTGSGKTLVYVIPIIQALMNRIVPRIRALVVVPSRDLVQQVWIAKLTFDAYTKGTDLHCYHIHSLTDEYVNELDVLNNDENVDIVIATPGKLVEYIKTNPSFNIQNLQYLVVDEADKLLLQSFDNWIHVVYNQHTQSPLAL